MNSLIPSRPQPRHMYTHTHTHTHRVGGVIMLLGFLLFEAQFIHVVSITFTALILTELLMVALTIRTWHGLMLLAELFSVVVYVASLAVLRDYFGESVTHDIVHVLVAKYLLASPFHLYNACTFCVVSPYTSNTP